MVGRVQHRRFSTAAAGWSATLKYGEVSVNPVRRRMAVGDTDGTVREMLAVTFYDARSQYAVGDVVLQASLVYKCNTTIGTPEAFNASKWDQITYTQGTLETYFNTKYSLLTHNHDATYAALGHNHDATYAALGHNHDGTYSLVGHNHDATYAALSHNHDSTYVNVNGDTMSGTLTIGAATALIANGKISVNAGATPTGDIHVKNTSEAQILVESTAGSTTKARLDLKNTGRAWSVYGDSTTLVLRDETGTSNKVTLTAGGGVQIGAPTGGDKGANTLNAAGVIYVQGSPVAQAPTVEVFTADGTFDVAAAIAAGRTYAYVKAWAGGASGGKRQAGSSGGGGGGGGYKEGWFKLSALASTVAVTVGLGGVAQTTASTVGNDGGDTSFGSHLTAYGGSGGWGNDNAAPGGGGGGQWSKGGAATNTKGGEGGQPSLPMFTADAAVPTTQFGAGGVAIDGGPNQMGGGGGAGAGAKLGGSSVDGGGGGGAGTNAATGLGVGGNSVRGGGGGGGAADTTGAAGGTSEQGGAGGKGADGAGAGTAGTAPGGGGGGSQDGTSGAGARGELQVILF